VTPLIPTAQARLDGSDWRWGWNVGALLDFGQGTRVGVRRALVDLTETGWNSISALTVTATSGPAAGMPVSSTPLDFKNSWRAGVGLEYQAYKF
jgi:long-subunit fatty acid transport protein